VRPGAGLSLTVGEEKKKSNRPEDVILVLRREGLPQCK